METKLGITDNMIWKMEIRIQNMEEQIERGEKNVKKVGDQFDEKICELENRLAKYEMRLQSKLADVKEVPYLEVCGYQDEWYKSPSTISYDSILSEYHSGGGEGQLDITTGIFTAGTPGFYTVTYSGRSAVDPDQYVLMYLYHNGVRVDQSEWVTYLSDGDQRMEDQGSRTLTIHLGQGDILELRAEDFTGELFRLVFCLFL